MLFGGLIGIERGRKHRAAGFRTHMLVSLGAALAMLIGEYNYLMMQTQWAEVARQLNVHIDVCRMGAQVINGIGFLGAGTILITPHQEVKGLTTAAGLWASACMGLALGVGFYEGALISFFFIFLCMRLLPFVENFLIDHARNMNIYVDFVSIDCISEIVSVITAQGAHIYEVDINSERRESSKRPSAVISIRLKQKTPHTQVLTAVSSLAGVYITEEV